MSITDLQVVIDTVVMILYLQVISLPTVNTLSGKSVMLGQVSALLYFQDIIILYN